MKDLVIRTFEENDHISVKGILKVIGWADHYVVGQLECFKKLLDDKEGEIFVASYLGIIVGFIQTVHHGWTRLSYVHGLVVHPDYRRLAIAKSLVERVEISSESRGNQGLYVDTPVDNLGERKFYMSLGFRESYTMPEFYESGFDGVTFQKFFSGSMQGCIH